MEVIAVRWCREIILKINIITDYMAYYSKVNEMYTKMLKIKLITIRQ